MKKVLPILFALCVTSAFIFPFQVFFMPSQNTKNVMAAVGLVLLGMKLLSSDGRFYADKGLLSVLGMACAVSFISLVAIVYNNTTDTSYVTYISTALIWLLGGYAVVECIRWAHGYASADLVIQYLFGVSVMQCIFALIIDNNQAFENFVIRWFYNGVDFFSRGGRLYGIGAGLDVAGVRFSAILVATAHYCLELGHKGEGRRLAITLLMFCFVVVVGNMISRTTTVGAILAIAYWCVNIFRYGRHGGGGGVILRKLVLVLLLVVPVFTILYNTNRQMHDNLRFGFEGFFSMVEQGHWETNSNNELEKMVKWPDNLKTWIIGDGYMLDVSKQNPYWLKQQDDKEEVFYMGTDIGYCRFIFYFGIVGLLINMLYFVTMAIVCSKRCPNQTMAFLMVLAVNFIVWAKVSTDVFAIFAVLLMVGAEENALAEAEDDEDDEEEEEDDEEELPTKGIVPQTQA